jgi:DNA-binding MarR family transcriptional regulator
MPVPVSDLREHLGFWLRIVSNGVSHSFARKLQADGFIVAEWVLLRELYDGALAPSRLAEQMGMTKGGITKLADRLVAKGLIERMADPDDKRAQTLGLTAQGRGVVPALAGLADHNDEEFFGDLTDADRDLLDRLLRKIVEKHKLTAIPVE